MTFKLLKRRYRSADNDEKLRELEYFNHPYAKGSSIRLVDDIEMGESISLTSLSSEFVALENNTKRGKKNATEREQIRKKDDDEDTLEISSFEPFDMNKQIYQDLYVEITIMFGYLHVLFLFSIFTYD